MTTDRKAGWGKAVLVAISGEFVHLWSAVQCLARTRVVTGGRTFIVAWSKEASLGEDVQALCKP